jgi:tyrosyl-tRNA synthetase
VVGQRGLAHLLEDRAVVLGLERVLDELLRDRRGALCGALLDDVLPERAPDALDVEALVAVEAPVLDRDDRALHRRRDLVGADQDPVLAREHAERAALEVDQHRVPGVVELGPVLELRQVGGDRHHHPEEERDPAQQRDPEQDQQQPPLLELRLDGRGAGRLFALRLGLLAPGPVVPRLGRRGRGGAAAGRHDAGRPHAEKLALAPMASATSEPAEQAAWLTRNAVDALPEGGLEARLKSGRPLRVKLGIDPTAPDIHLGHTVVLQKLREFQDAGHVVVLIVGDYTARVGDPSGQSATRPVLSGEEIDANALTFRRQAGAILREDRLELRRNGEWLDMAMEELFRLARTTTVAQLLERDDFARRHAAGEPISVLELLYPLMQGYDSVAVRSDVELGGTDQKFNLLLARDVQRAYGAPEQAILTMPILPGTDGERKMSKSLGNDVGVSAAPEEMYGRTMSIPDSALETWWDLLLGEAAPDGQGPRDAKRALARRLVERFHGEAAAAAAEAHFDRVIVEHRPPEDVPEADFQADDGTAHLPAVIVSAFGGSRSEARRLLEQGGVRLDGEALGPADQDLPAERLDGALLQVGKRRFARLRAARR